MSQFFSIFNITHNDAAQPWQLGFQDSAAPGFTGIDTLHETISFYLILISITVFWVLFNIIYYYNNNKNSISYKYFTHGSLMSLHVRSTSVPLYSFLHNTALALPQIARPFKRYKRSIAPHSNLSLVLIRNYSSNKIDNTVEEQDLDVQLLTVKIYDNVFELKSIILKENKNKSGIYSLINKINGNFYIGSSKNLNRRFLNYFNLNYISKVKNNLTISRALIKIRLF